MNGMSFITDCITSTAAIICPMVDEAQEITRRTFLKHVNRQSLRNTEGWLGYDADPRRGITMAGDYHVSYFKSRYRGNPCIFFVNSAIEYIFTQA